MILRIRQTADGEVRLHGTDRIVRLPSFECSHCAVTTELEGRARPADAGAICKSCMRPICLRCAGLRVRGEPCDPWEKKLERWEVIRR